MISYTVTHKSMPPAPIGKPAVVLQSDLLCMAGGKLAFSKTKGEPLKIRAQIIALQEAMIGMTGAQTECPVRHIFAPGLYAREMTIPEGIVIVGKIHKHAHVNTLSKGRCSVMTEFGPMELVAPCSFVSQPGTKRVVIAHEETVWTTYHPTDETDVEKIEEQIIAPSYDALPLLEAVSMNEVLEIEEVES